MDKELFFFADENVSNALINWLKDKRYKASGVKEENMAGASAVDIVLKCFSSRSIILTHDNDFGKIIFAHSISFFSIIYLRPGHFDGAFHLPTLSSILKNKHLITLGTLIIGLRTINKIKIRIKQIK